VNHSLTERVSALVTVFGSFIMGWLAHGFIKLDAPTVAVGCFASVLLFAWTLWEILDV